MAVQEFAQNIKNTNTQPQMRNTLLTFSAAFMGVVIGVVAAFAVIMPMVRSEFADQSRQLSQKLVSMVPASTTLSSCVQPSSGAGAGAGTGQVLGASAVMPPAGHHHGAPQGPTTSFVSKLVSGVFATTTGTISDTGPNSTNEITTTNTNTTTVTNDNNIEISNNNVQLGGSGDASVKNNTTGGSATSGNTDNSNSSSDTVNINN